MKILESVNKTIGDSNISNMIKDKNPNPGDSSMESYYDSESDVNEHA
jgi:hypothetical protein